MATATDKRLLQRRPAPSPGLLHGAVAADWVDGAADTGAGNVIRQADGWISVP